MTRRGVFAGLAGLAAMLFARRSRAAVTPSEEDRVRYVDDLDQTKEHSAHIVEIVSGTTCHLHVQIPIEGVVTVERRENVTLDTDKEPQSGTWHLPRGRD